MREDGRPIAERGLAEETHGRVPGSGIAGALPAPIGSSGEGEPDGSAKGTGEMGEGGVAGDHEVETVEGGGGVHEGASGFVEPAAEIENEALVCDIRKLILS